MNHYYSEDDYVNYDIEDSRDENDPSLPPGIHGIMMSF